MSASTGSASDAAHDVVLGIAHTRFRCTQPTLVRVLKRKTLICLRLRFAVRLSCGAAVPLFGCCNNDADTFIENVLHHILELEMCPTSRFSRCDTPLIIIKYNQL